MVQLRRRQLKKKSDLQIFFICSFLFFFVVIIGSYPNSIDNATTKSRELIDSSELESIILDFMAKFSDPSISNIYNNYTLLDEEGSPSILYKKNTAQGKAFDWLRYHDEYSKIHIRTNEEIIQRFVIVTLFFSTEGSYNDNFATQFTPTSNKRAMWTSKGTLGFLNSNKHECNWNERNIVGGSFFGIKCSKSMKVEEIYLANVDLNGYIPCEIGLLSDLVKLDLSDNYLQHAIPTSFGLLQKVKEIHLNGNLLVGPIPAELSSLQKLQTLRLHSNRVHGENVDSIFCNSRNEASYADLSMDCLQSIDHNMCSCCTKCCNFSDDCVFTTNDNNNYLSEYYN